MKGTAAKRNVSPGSCVSTGAKFPVDPVESAPMFARPHCACTPTVATVRGAQERVVSFTDQRRIADRPHTTVKVRVSRADAQ